MRKLFLLRHAKSDWNDRGLDDIDRPLNARGNAAAAVMSAYMAREHIRPALVLVSTAVRTRATWDCIEPAMEGVPVAFEPGIYEASRGDLLRRLRAIDDHVGSVMLIGHNPGIGRLATALVGTNGQPEDLERLDAGFPTATLAEIELGIHHWAEMEAGCGSLVRLVRPKDLDSGPFA